MATAVSFSPPPPPRSPRNLCNHTHTSASNPAVASPDLWRNCKAAPPVSPLSQPCAVTVITPVLTPRGHSFSLISLLQAQALEGLQMTLSWKSACVYEALGSISSSEEEESSRREGIPPDLTNLLCYKECLAFSLPGDTAESILAER